MDSRSFMEAIESVADDTARAAHAQRAETTYEGASATPDGQLHRAMVKVYGGQRGSAAAGSAAAAIETALQRDPTLNGRIGGVIATLVGPVETDAGGESMVVVQISGYASRS